MIVIEHEADELRECDRLLILRDGQIAAQGPPASVMSQLELLETCGVHPPELNRALAMLGIHTHAATVDAVEVLIRRAFSFGRNLLGRYGIDGPENKENGSTLEPASISTG